MICFAISGQQLKSSHNTIALIESDAVVDVNINEYKSSKSLSLTSSSQLRMIAERAVPKNVTAQTGRPVYLHCIVEPIGDRTVIVLCFA